MIMRIQLIGRGVAEVVLSSGELSACGVSAEHLSPAFSDGRRLLYLIFDALEDICGLRRDGHFTFVECRPYINGGCRLSVGFTDEPSGRLYAFDRADDLLDALNHLRYNEYCNTENMNIHQSGDKFFMFFPRLPNDLQAEPANRHNLAVLSEYSGNF